MSSYVYIGNWCLPSQISDEPKGIGLCRYMAESGALEYIKTVCPEVFVGAAFFDKKRSVLYVTDERANLPGMRQGGGGQILAFAADPDSGELCELSRCPSYGANPSYLVTDGGDYLLVANHGTRSNVTVTETDENGEIHIKTLFDESSIVLFPLEENGAVGKPCDIFRLSGEGPGVFQLGPHAHCIEKSPLGNLYAVCDKGGDQLFMFTLDYLRRKIVLCEGSPVHRSPGSAPRYCVFHPRLPYLYINKEYKTVVSVFKYDSDGQLEHINTVDSLPDDITPPVGASQSGICISNDGKYLYTLMRQVNAISVFEISETDGSLNMIQCMKNACDGPRHCAVSADGKYLVVAGFYGKEVVSYPIGEDGKLLPAAASVAQPMPGTVTFK